MKTKKPESAGTVACKILRAGIMTDLVVQLTEREINKLNYAYALNGVDVKIEKVKENN